MDAWLSAWLPVDFVVFLGSAQDGGWRSPNDGSSAAYFGKDLLLSRTVYNWFEFVSNGSYAQ